MSEKTYQIHQGNPEDYRVINQTGVKQAITHEPKHNACWDSHLTPEGELYFSVCSELTVGEFAKLYHYDFDTNSLRECFYTRDYLLKSDRYIRDSKFHTSIQSLPDGKLIMITHTTDKAPQHPAWLPYAFVSNPWEGFAGGELIVYDPKTGDVDLKGIPAPRESIYGAVYSPGDNAYYMLGYMRGHLYRYDCAARKCEDKGQATEYHCYRVALGPDQNVYFSTRSGFLMRYNVQTQKIEDTGVRIPCDKSKGTHAWPFTYMGPCQTGPDGRMYITGNFTDLLSAFDPRTGKMECLGKMMPADEYVDNDSQHCMIPGMAFDRYGVLWYVTMSFRDNEDEYYKVPSMLWRWDVTRGGKPEPLGLFGTPERVQTFSVNMYIDHRRDILYSVSTNHSKDSPDVIAVDLKKFRPVCGEKGAVATDPLIFAPGAPEFHEFGVGWHNTKAAIRENTSAIKARSVTPVRLWKQLPMDSIADAAVRALRWRDNDTVEGIAGKDRYYRFLVKNGELIEWTEQDAATAQSQLPEKPAPIPGLPGYPGRMWRAGAVCACDWLHGSRMVGTEDGFLARVNADGSVFSVGPAVCQGPVRALCADLAHGVLWGVGGDEEDVGNIFRYDEERGLEYLGYMASDSWTDSVGTAANFVLSAAAVSPDGKKIAVGACDRLACVYICRMEA